MRLLPLAAGLLAGCGEGAEAPADDVFRPDYRGTEVRLLDETLVNLVATMEGARGVQDVADYAECALAQDAADRGFGFARQVRTNVVEEGGVWVADAVYTVSPALPRGLRTIDVEVAVKSCRDRDIPTT